MTANQIMEKFYELLNRQADISRFTRTERMIWFLLITRSEIAQDGFTSVFDQALSKAELVESIGYMKELELSETAAGFEEVLRRYQTNGYFDAEGRIDKRYSTVTDEFMNEIDKIGDQIMARDDLWKIEEKLAALLEQESRNP